MRGSKRKTTEVVGTVSQPDSEFTIDLNGCARCHGLGHPQLTFRRLTYPLSGVGAYDGAELTHWALCPTNGEPILLSIRPKK
jgi:hypothetical protein